MKNFVDFIYTFLIGVGVTLFVSLGIWTFYGGPKFPQYPPQASYSGPGEAENKKLEAEQRDFDREMKEYEKKENYYSRNVAGISLVAGVAAFLSGMLLIKRNDIVGEGLAIGGIFTQVYAAGRGVSAESRPLVFASVTIILVMAVLLALTRRDIFVLSKSKQSARK